MMAVDVFIKLKMGLRNVYYGGGRIIDKIKHKDVARYNDPVAQDRQALKKPDSYDKEK